MLPLGTFQFHLSNTFQMFHKCICWLQCSKIDPDLEMFLRCSHSFLGTLAPSVWRVADLLDGSELRPGLLLTDLEYGLNGHGELAFGWVKH